MIPHIYEVDNYDSSRPQLREGWFEPGPISGCCTQGMSPTAVVGLPRLVSKTENGKIAPNETIFLGSRALAFGHRGLSRPQHRDSTLVLGDEIPQTRQLKLFPRIRRIRKRVLRPAKGCRKRRASASHQMGPTKGALHTDKTHNTTTG